MAASAKFSRTPPSDPTDVDGFDPKPNPGVGFIGFSYQMVPVGRTRQMLVKVSGGPVMILCERDFCHVSASGSAPSSSVLVDHQTPAEVRLTLHGRSPGRTLLMAVDPQRHELLDKVVLSVKAERVVTYNLHRLRDLSRETPRTIEDLTKVMAIVERIYLRQANVRLVRVNARPEPLFVRKDLGDPIRFPLKGESEVANILVKQLTELGMTSQNANLISAWNLVQADDVLHGRADDIPGTLAVITPRPDTPHEAQTFAHELGHVLGMEHEVRTGVLMSGSGAPLSGSDTPVFQLIASEIDFLNSSGGSFSAPP